MLSETKDGSSVAEPKPAFVDGCSRARYPCWGGSDLCVQSGARGALRGRTVLEELEYMAMIFT